MPIPSPQLDDLRYDSIVEELLRKIPVYAPEWTDWNDSDPGVTLIQLFAHLAEQVGYRLNRVPEKNHIELLKLLGVQLRPSLSATSKMAVFLADATQLSGFNLDAGSRFIGSGSTAAIFESDRNIDIVPAEPITLITTRNPFLWDLLRLDDTGAREPVPSDAILPKKVPTPDCHWMTLAWDGKKPGPKDLPVAPIVLQPPPQGEGALPYFWAGLSCNPALNAGFAGVTVTLTVQFDDDEQPDPRLDLMCSPINAPGEKQPPNVNWLAYWDAKRMTMLPVPGRIDDSTEKLTRSGSIRFTVPFSLGAIPTSSFVNLRDAVMPSTLDSCEAIAGGLRDSIAGKKKLDPKSMANLLTSAINSTQAAKTTTRPAVGHPLDPAIRENPKLNCWLRFGPLESNSTQLKLRYLGFNAIPVTNAITVTGELLGRADGRPGQSFTLAHGNILAGTLEVGVQEGIEPDSPLVTWRETPSLDGAGPNDRVFELDAEAGSITFGDGKRGRIPPLSVGSGAVVAVRYRWGGGISGEMSTGTILTGALQFNGFAGVVNFVSARGGRDSESVEQAKLRARKELSTRSRAVTSSDFEWIALQTPTVRVRRAIVVPRRRPLASLSTLGQFPSCTPTPPPKIKSATPLGGVCAPDATELRFRPNMLTLSTLKRLQDRPNSFLESSDCGPSLPSGPAGLDDSFEAPGVVSVVIVPDGPQPPPPTRPSLVELVPTRSFLQQVCVQLDRHRLVTTEVHVVSPQYCRLCRVFCRVKPRSGYSRTLLRDLVADSLATYLDVLIGGEEKLGAPFGGQIHIADLVAQVFRTEGVQRVDDVRAHFVRTKSNAAFREGNLVLCPAATDDHDRIDLAPEETTSIDLSSFTLDTI